MSPDDVPSGLGQGLKAAAGVGSLIGLGLALPKVRDIYMGSEFTASTGESALSEMLLRVPFATALPEELVFRAALPAALERRMSVGRAVLVSSCVFGLSHALPTWRQIEANPIQRGLPVRRKAARVGTSIALTTAAGFAFAALQKGSGSIVAPWLAHTAANAFGYAARLLATQMRDHEGA